jgi:hypothetical protein
MRINKPPKDGSAVHFCSVCGSAWSTQAEAVDCMAIDMPCSVKPGDIVVLERGYGWYTNEDWVLDQNGHDFHGKTYRFLYVIVAVTTGHDFGLFNENDVRYGHSKRIHIYGDAVDQCRHTWTTDNGSHITPKLWRPKTKADRERAARLLATAQPFMGNPSHQLL